MSDEEKRLHQHEKEDENNNKKQEQRPRRRRTLKKKKPVIKDELRIMNWLYWTTVGDRVPVSSEGLERDPDLCSFR